MIKITKDIPMSNEFAALRDAIYMGYTRGRQKAIEKAFKNLDKSMAESIKRSWWHGIYHWKTWRSQRGGSL